MEKRPWPLFFSAPLLGLSQNILIVFTPIFIDKTMLSVETVALLMSLGSALFLFSAPVWAKLSLRCGYAKVLLGGILGFSMSFTVMLLALWGSVSLQWPILWVILTLIISRLLYGITASAIVPSCQAWLTELSHVDHTMKRLAELSTFMALGRLIGPLLAMFLIWLGWLTPLLFLCLAPLICLICVFRFSLSSQVRASKTEVKLKDLKSEKSRLNNKLAHSLLISITLISITYSNVTFLLIPMVQDWLQYSSEETSQYLSLLMSLAAITMVLTHGITAKVARVDHFNMMLLGNMMLLLSLIFMQLAVPHILLIAVPLLSAAFAILQLQITTLLCHLAGKGTKAIATGLVSKYQTIGYVLGAGLLWLTHADIDTSLQILSLLGLAQLASLMIWRFNTRSVEELID
jgi:MFS family permease